MVYGAFNEKIMRRAYQELIKSTLAQEDLVDSAVEICEELDRLLVEKIWPLREKKQLQAQAKELERPNNTNEGRLTDGRNRVSG